MSKDLWFEEYTRLQFEIEDEHGRMPNDAEDMVLADRAHGAARERMADMADDLRKRSKGE